MLCGYPPFGGDANKEIIKNVQVGKLSFDHEEFKVVSPESISLIKDILVRDPNKRMPLDQILDHGIFPKFKEIKFSLDLAKVKQSLDKFVNESTLYRCIKTLLFKMYKVESQLKVIFLEANISHTSELTLEEYTQALRMINIEVD